MAAVDGPGARTEPFRRVPRSGHPSLTARAAWIVLAATVVVGLTVGVPAGPAAADQRYHDLVFSAEDVEVTGAVVFASADPATGLDRDLALDLYEPPADPGGPRPVVIWVHGGGFASGNRSEMRPFALDSARRGYVAATIDYRAEGETLAGLMVALGDARRAVRWFRANAAELEVDPERIVMGGYSAGAVTALNAAYSGPVASDLGAAQPWDIAAAVSFAGATGALVSPGEAPAVFFHGDRDPRVWYDAGPLPGFSAVEVCERARAAGVVCEFHTHVGATHLLSPYRSADLEATAHFLSCQVGAPSPFTDTTGAWFEADAAWLAREDVVGSDPGASFRGRARLTRGQYVDLLWRLRGRPVAAGHHGYPDVAASAWFADALDWATEAGVVPSFPGGRFRPHKTVTRGQAVDQLWRAVGGPGGWAHAGYPDVPVGAYPGPALDWAAAHDLVADYPGGRFRRGNPVTRGQLARMIRQAAREATAWSTDLAANPPPAACFRVGDPARLG